MLIKVKVENFKSFERVTELNMLSSNRIRKNPDHKITIKNNISLLKYAVIYGANASGKSNLIDVFNFIKYSVSKFIPANAAEMFCKTSKKNIDKDSSFEIQFTLENKFYAYGFSVLLKDRTIKEEWLYELCQNGSYKILFERENAEKPRLGSKVFLDEQDRQKIDTYLEDFDAGSNMLFLTFMNSGKKYTNSSNILFFKEVFRWITDDLYVCTPYTSLNTFKYYSDDTTLSKITSLIKFFDTGITDIKLKEITLDDLKNELPRKIFDDLTLDIKNQIEEKNFRKMNVSMRSHQSFFNISINNQGELKITTIDLHHGPSFYPFSFKEESDGTRRLFELIDILLNKSANTVYVVDEMERSLHPKLTAEFIKRFNIEHTGEKIQLIFTTHESSIMDQELFRRDEIWFIERDKDNNSNIYSLDKFKERYDKKLSKAYLDGRYGAIPVFSEFSFEDK